MYIQESRHFAARRVVSCAGSVSQTRMQPSAGGLPAGVVVPTAASLDALEAMEAGLPPPSGGAGGGSGEGLGGAADGKRSRRFRGWRGTGLMLPDRCGHASMPFFRLHGTMLRKVNFYSGATSGMAESSRVASLTNIK